MGHNLSKVWVTSAEIRNGHQITLGLELQLEATYSMGVGNQTGTLKEQLLSHLSSPWFIFMCVCVSTCGLVHTPVVSMGVTRGYPFPWTWSYKQLWADLSWELESQRTPILVFLQSCHFQLLNSLTWHQTAFTQWLHSLEKTICSSISSLSGCFQVKFSNFNWVSNYISVVSFPLMV